MKSHLQAILILSEICFIPMALAAQGGGSLGSQMPQPGGILTNINPLEMMQKRWSIVGQVVTLQGDPVQGAKVVLEQAASSKRRSLKANSNGEFRTLFQWRADLNLGLNVHLRVTKKGFLPAQETIEYGGADTAQVYRITLRPARYDENLLSQEDLVSILSARLRNLNAPDGLSKKAEKDYQRGTDEFLDRDNSERAIGYFAKVVKRDPACAKCRTMLALAELAAGDWDGAARDAGIAISKSSESNNGSPEAFLLSGVMQSWKDDPGGASNLLSQAVKRAPGDALALQELARAQIQNHEWASADANLSKAIDAGAGPAARLLRVQALLGEGEPDKANTELTAYLAKRDIKKMPAPVRQIWSSVQEQVKVKEAYAGNRGALNGKTEYVDYSSADSPELKGVEPAKSQDELKPILEATGKNVEQFFKDFQNTSSLEEIHEEKAGQYGNIKGKIDEKFHYVCLTSNDHAARSFKEYRANVVTGQSEAGGLNRGYMLTLGFTSVSLIFHPAFQSESTFRYVGRQKIDGRDTYIVAFAQKPTKTTLNGLFTDGVSSAATYSQGLAWIDAQSYQILRLRTDLLKPLPNVKLKRETTEIGYQQVHFKNSSLAFWLPRQVAVTVDWNGKTLHNEHRYSDFKLFDVSTSEKIGSPKEAEQPVKGDPTGKTPM